MATGGLPRSPPDGMDFVLRPSLTVSFVSTFLFHGRIQAADSWGRHEALGTGFGIGLSVYFRCSGCNEVEEVFSFFGKERRRLREGE